MAHRFLSVLALLVLFTPVTSAQHIYKWKDNKGQWHFSNSPPAEVGAERVKGLDINPPSATQTTVPTDQPEQSQPESSPRKIVVPFTRDGNSIIVQGIVNGRQNNTVEFIMDTGASLTAIPWDMAPQLNIDPLMGDPFPIMTAGGARIVPMVEINRLMVGGAEVRNLSVLVISIGGRGLLGMDFLSNFQVNFNYAQNEITLEPQKETDEEAKFLVWQQRFQNYYRMRKNVKTALSRFPEHKLRQELLRYRYSALQPKKEFLNQALRIVDRKISDLEYRAHRAGVPRKFWK